VHLGAVEIQLTRLLATVRKTRDAAKAMKISLQAQWMEIVTAYFSMRNLIPGLHVQYNDYVPFLIQQLRLVL
jgi:hypothetical protein